MTKSFSERNGIIVPLSANPKEMSAELQNRLWNATNEYIYQAYTSDTERSKVIKFLWDKFFKKDIGTLYSGFNGYTLKEIKEEFFIL